LDPGSSETVFFDLIPSRSGFVKGDILLEGDQFQPDNDHFFSLEVPEVRQVLIINEVSNGTETYLTAALQAAEQIQGRISVQQATSNSYQDAGQLDNFDVVVLNGLDRINDDLQESLVRTVQSGRGLVLFPSPRADFSSYNRLLDRLNAGQFVGFRGTYGSFDPVARIDRIRDGHPIIEEIFEKQEDEDISTELPGLFYYLRHNPESQSGTLTVLQSELVEPILLDHRFGNGRVLISTVGADPGWSSFPGNPLFAPIFYRTVLFAMSGDQGGFNAHVLGQPFEWTGQLQGDRIVLSNNQTDFFPEIELQRDGSTKITYPATEWQPGIYQIRTESGNIQVAANFDISESDFYTLSDENTFELLTSKAESVQFFGQRDRSLSEVQQELRTSGFGAEIWYWFVIAAITLLIIEMAISRWYKAETIT
jgi:type 1 glutamine amidotransferase